MILTEPRTKIVRALVVRPRLSVSQIYDVAQSQTESKRRSVRRCLKQLVDMNVLRREPLVKSVSFSGSGLHWEYVYMLTSNGVRVAQRRGLDPEGAAYASEAKSPWLLQHEATLADFDAAICAAFPNAYVSSRDQDLRHSFMHEGRLRTVHPDRLYYFNSFYYFLELERGGQGSYKHGISQRLRKIRNLGRYAQSLAFKDRYKGMEDFYVLIAVDTPVRRDNLVASMIRRDVRSCRFKVCAESDWRADIAGRIWKSSNGETVSL